METRQYPSCCTSMYCGNYGDSCNGCENKPVLDTFNSWKKETLAVQDDHIWNPNSYTATIQAKPAP